VNTGAAHEPEPPVAMAARCDTGLCRGHNEDCVAVDPGRGFMLVADGMGGHNAGEIAARMAVDHTTSGLLKGPWQRQSSDARRRRCSASARRLYTALLHANRAIWQTARTRSGCTGMGTTIVAAVFHADRVSVASVGDSRLYRLRDGRLEQLTRDHSLQQELVDRGYCAPEEARAAVDGNVITRALGIESDVAIDIAEYGVISGDRYLLCSDGLSDMVAEKVITDAMARTGVAPADIVEELIERANAAGGRDNIAVAVAQARAPFPVRRSWIAGLAEWLR